MVTLPNSGKVALRYPQYILELQEFFALHDLRYGNPQELGLFAARLASRDSFPSELASMVRSFIFREAGSFSMHDLRTVVALAVGGATVESHAAELQHPLHDLSAFLSHVAKAPFDQPPPTLSNDEVAEAPMVVEPVVAEPIAKEPVAKEPAAERWTSTSTIAPQPNDTQDSFVQPVHSSNALIPAMVPEAPLRRLPPASLAPQGMPRRRLWGAVAVGLPILLLVPFLLFNHSGKSAPTPPSHVVATPSTATASTFAPQSGSPAPASTAVAALPPPPIISSYPAPTPSPTVSSPGATAPSAVAPASSTRSRSRSSKPTPRSHPAANLAGQPSPADGNIVLTASVEPASTSNADSASSEGSSASPRSATLHAGTTAASNPRVPAQQGALGISSGIMSSHLLSFSSPKYPKIANLTHAEGQVILQAVVSKSGRVSAVKALSGPRTLRKAAENAVRDWRYSPYVTDGHPADIATIITIDVKSPR